MNVKPWLIDHLSNNNTRNSKSIQSQAYNQQKSRQQSKLANLTQGPKTAQQHLQPIQHKTAFTKGEEKKNFRYDMNFNKQLTKIENKYFKNNDEKEAARAGSSLGLQNVTNQYLNQNSQKRQGLDYKSAQYNSLNILNKNSQTSLIQLPALFQQPVKSISQMQNDHNNSQILQTKIDEILIQNPNYLLHQHNICKQDNKERLKDINNLKDLVNFKVKTVADKLIEKNQRQLQQIESIPIDDDFYRNRLEAIKLSQIQTQSSINTIKNICDPILANRGYPQLLSKHALNPLKTKKQFESNLNIFTSKMLDIQSQSQIIEEAEDKYEIPQNLKQNPKNYNLIFANSQFKDFAKKQTTNETQNEHDQQENENNQLTKNDSFEIVKQQYENQQQELHDESVRLKQYHQIQFQDQQKKLEESIKKIQIDPVKLLKSYFQNKKKDKVILQTKDLQKSNFENDLFQNSIMQQSEKNSSNGFQNDHFESKMTNKREIKDEPLLVGAVHENYVISKYQKKLRTGKLEKEIEHNNNELQILENIQRQLKQNHINQIYNVINETSKVDKKSKNQGESMKDLTNQIKMLGPQKIQMLTQLLQEFVQQDNQNQSLEKQQQNLQQSIEINTHNYSKLEPVEIPKVNYEQFINDSKLELQQNFTSQELSQQNINTSSIEDQNSLQNNISSVKKMRRELINIFEDSINSKTARTKQKQNKNYQDQNDLINNIDKIIQNSNVKDSTSINNENLGIELSQILNLNDENQSSPLKQISQNKLAVENLLKQIKGELSFSEIRKQKVYIEDIVEDRSTNQHLSKTQNDSRGIFNNDSYNDYQTQAGSINMEKSKIIGKSGLVHSELLKYQCAKNQNKNTQNDKKIDKLKKNQKRETYSVQNKMQNKNEKCQFKNSLPQGSIPVQNMSQEQSQMMHNEQSFELTAKNSLFINQSQDVILKKDKSFEQYSLNNGMKLNIHGSLPQIKQQLDKKQFSILLMNDQSNLKNENFQFLINDQNIQTQNQEIVSDKNIYQQKFHDKQTSFNNQQSQDSSILNVNLHYDIPISTEKENQVLNIAKSQTDQQINSIRSQYGTMKGSQNEKDGEYDSIMRISGVKLPYTAQNQINKIKNKERIYNFKQIQQAVQKQDKNISPLRTLNELENSTPKYQEFTLMRAQKEKIEEDENSYKNQIDNQNLYNQYYDQNFEIKNSNITQIQKDSDKDSPGYHYGENDQIMKQSKELLLQNQIKKPFSLTKSSRISIFSNQQNKTFSNNFKKSEDLMAKQNSGKIKSSKSSQARSDNYIRMQNVKDTLNTQKQQVLQSQTQFNQTYQNFKDIEGFKQRKNHTNIWKRNDEETEKSQNSMQSGMIKGKMNLSAMMTENRLNTKNHDKVDSAEKIKSEADNIIQNQQNIKMQDTLINETLSNNNTVNKQLKQRQQFIQNTLIQIENTRNRQIDQNLDLQQQNQAHTQTKFEQIVQIKPKNYECQFNENPISQKQKKLEFNIEKLKEEKGYHSSNEPYMDQASSELYDQILKDHFVQKGCWIPSRFKMFPRFAIFSNKNKQALDDSSTNHHEQYISLSSNVLALLAGFNITDQQCINSYLQPPAITNQSRNLMHVNPNSLNSSMILTPKSKVLKMNERVDTEGTAHLEQSYREKMDMQIQKGSSLNFNVNQNKMDDQASATFESGLRNDDQENLIRIQQSSDQQQNDYLENKLGTVRLHNNNQLLQVANQIQLGEGAGQSTTILNDYTSFDKPQSTFKNQKFRNRNDDFSSGRNINGTNQQSVMDVLINNEINIQSSFNQNNKFTINQTINYSSIDLEKNQSINNHNKIYVQNNIGHSTQEQQKASQMRKGEEVIKTQNHSEQISNPDLSNLQAFLNEQNQSLIIKHFDPFDKVVLSKGMDNQILTSYRTILKSNNMLSNTLKVVHQRFLAKQLNKSLISRLPRGKHLYPISMEILQKFAQEMLIQDELENMNENQRRDLINNLEQLNLLSQHYNIDNINLDSFYIQNQAQSNLNVQQLNIIKIDNLPQPQNSSEFNVNVKDQSQIVEQHQKNILSGQGSMLKKIVNQRKQIINEDKNSSSNPQDESKLEIGSKNAINNNFQENSIVEAETHEIEDEKSQTFSKIKLDKLNSIKQASNALNENQKSTLANKTLVSINTQSIQNSQINKQNQEGSKDINDQDLGSDKIIDLKKSKKTTMDQNSQAPRVNYLIEKQDESIIKQKFQKRQIIKKIEGKILKKRENMHIPIYDISTGIVVRQEQNEFQNSKNFMKDAKSSSYNQLNLLSLTQQIAQAILSQKHQINSPVDKFQVESWKMNLFNMDPQYSQANQKQIQQNNSLYSSQIDEEYSKNEGRNAAKLQNKYNTDLMNSKKQKEEILLRLEENLSSQNNYYGNTAQTNQKQAIKFSSINLSSHHLNQSEEAIQQKKEDADSMKNIQKDYKQINVYDKNQQSFLQGALNINYRIPVEQQDSSSIYMVTPGRSLYANQVIKQNSLKNNTYLRSQNQKRQQEYTKTEQVRFSLQGQSFEKKIDKNIQSNLNQNLDQLKSQGESRNSNIRNSLSFNQGNNTEMLSKTRANLEADSKTYHDYGKDQLKMNIEDSMQQYQYNGNRQQESPYASEHRPLSYKKPQALQNLKYVDFDNADSKINLIVLDKPNTQQNNIDETKISIPFVPAMKIDNDYKLNEQKQNTQNEDYEEQQIKKSNLDQKSEDKSQFKSFDKSFYKMNEVKQYKKSNNASRGSQDQKAPNQSLKNNQDLQHAVSFLNASKKQSERSNPSKAQDQGHQVITLQKIGNSNELTEQKRQETQIQTNRDNVTSFIGGQGNSTHLISQLDKSKDSYFDHSYEKNLQSKFVLQQNEHLQTGQQILSKIKQDIQDKNVKRKDKNNDSINKHENGQKNQKQTKKKQNQNFGGGYNSFANQSKIEEQKYLIQQALVKNQKQVKADEQKIKNESVGILMSVIQQTSNQNLDQIQKVLLNIVEQIKQHESVETEEKQDDQRLLMPETLQINSTLFSQSPRMGETMSFKQLNLDQTIEQQSIKKEIEVETQTQLQKLTQLIVSQPSKPDGKQQIKKVIDELYTSQKRYHKKINDRTDLINTCDFIFDLNKAKGIIQEQSTQKQQDVQLKIDHVKINHKK